MLAAFAAPLHLTPASRVCAGATPRARAPATCLAKRGGKRRAPRQRRRSVPGRAARDAAAPASAADGGDVEDLTEEFDEDVKEPLRPGKARPGRQQEVVKENGMAKVLDRLGELDVRKMSREQVLEGLVKGAWVGIGVLVGLFLVVHFIIVGDLLPH